MSAKKHGWTYRPLGGTWLCPEHSKIAEGKYPPRTIAPMGDDQRIQVALSILENTGDKPDMFRVRDAIAILKLGYLKPGGAK